MITVTQTGYFRPSDAQAAVGISRSTLYRWKKEGLIYARKVGGMSFFSVADVKSIIDREGGDLGGNSTPSTITP